MGQGLGAVLAAHVLQAPHYQGYVRAGALLSPPLSYNAGTSAGVLSPSPWQRVLHYWRSLPYSGSVWAYYVHRADLDYKAASEQQKGILNEKILSDPLAQL